MNKDSFVNCLITLIYPDRCIFCDKIVYTENELKICAICKRYNITFDMDYAMWYYKDAYRDAILAFKYKNRREYGKTIAYLMYYDIMSKHIASDIDLIIPVPLHKSKIAQRGYNQTEVLSHHLGKRLNVPVEDNTLIRARKTAPQMDLSKQERISNLKGSMKVIAPHKVKGKSILLIDDILTTGSTFDECSASLMQSEAKSVKPYSVCYQPFK